MGCEVGRRKLVIPDDCAYEDWMRIGSRLKELNGSVMWLLGDWLAFGHVHYTKEQWGGRSPHGLYEQLSLETGYSVSTLRNAKYLCSNLDSSRRRDNLTFHHAMEIVCLAPKEQVGQWIERVTTEPVTVKKLREQLRRAKSDHHREPNDEGTVSILELTRQFVRDFQAEAATLNPQLASKLKETLRPVLLSLGYSVG